MTLVDTSVVIDYLRSGDARLLALFQSLPGSVCGTTRAEILLERIEVVRGPGTLVQIRLARVAPLKAALNQPPKLTFSHAPAARERRMHRHAQAVVDV